MSFPLIERAINEIWGEQQTWVEREQIVNFLLALPKVRAVLKANEASLHYHSRAWYVGNSVDWFSKRITDGSSPFVGVFNRRKIRGKWAYMPAGHNEEDLIATARGVKKSEKKTYTRGVVIGSGNYGTVYRGELLIDGKPHLSVAIKSFHADFNENEFNILSRLDHPNIIRLLGTFEERDTLGHIRRSLVFEYADGGTLKDKIDSIPLGLPRAEAHDILLGVARGLAYLHSIQPRVIHRDIKPANILFKEGKPRISDVGLGRVIDTTTLTHRGGQTLAYAAPEMLQMSPDQRPVVSPKIDIYALGITAFQMLTGRYPYTGRHEVELTWDHLYAPIPEHRKVTGWARTLIEKCTLKDYHERWSAQEAVAFLERNNQSQGSTRQHSKQKP